MTTTTFATTREQYEIQQRNLAEHEADDLRRQRVGAALAFLEAGVTPREVAKWLHASVVGEQYEIAGVGHADD